MDANNAQIQRELAEMCRAAGQIERAEKTYRSLLLVVRRQPPGDEENAVGQSEVLFELHKIVGKHGDAEQAKELLESAIDAATQSDVEVRRLRRSMLAHQELDLLLRVIDLRLKVSTEAASQASLLADMAEVLDVHLNRGGDALEAMIKALHAAPTRLPLHDKARDLARRTGQTRRYVEAVDTIVDRLRRKDDPPVVADLLMRAGQALELDAGEPRAAAALYRRVEMIGERLAEAFFAQARVADALGDTEEQARALDKMLQLAGSEDTQATTAQIDALYRLAEIFTSTPGRRHQGINLLERAFAAEPRWAQAGRVLRVAASEDSSDSRLMALYERVARNSSDNELLLHHLECRTRTPDASPAHLREAVDIALELGQSERAEALLLRVVDTSRASGSLSSAGWALLALSQRRLDAGDLSTARDLLYEVAGIADATEVDSLGFRIAQRAAESNDTRSLAAEVYEFLRERNPMERVIWQPLLGLYRELGDGDRVSAVVMSTLPTLTEPGERNLMRIEHARFLIERLQRSHDALDVLREALRDDPDQLEAAVLLEETLQKLGDDEGMIDFLWNRFEDAHNRRNPETTVDVALRLGAIFDRTASPDAATVYRRALEVAPENRDLLRQVVAHPLESESAQDVAAFMERLLAVETPDRVPALASALASAWEQAGDSAGVQRTLELAHHAEPNDAGIHRRLEQWYRDNQNWLGLTGLMVSDAERLPAVAAVTRLREAARVFTDLLEQPMDAAGVLRRAREIIPTSTELATDLSSALAAAGDLDAAQAALGESLDNIEGAERVNLLLVRANLRQQMGNELGATEDLNQAYEIAPQVAADAYLEGLERLRLRSQENSDYDAERIATLRLAQILPLHDQSDRGRALLVAWVEREPRDAEPLRLLCAMDEAISHWDGVLAAAARLAYITEGEAQVAAGLQTADAAARAEHPADAIPVLEMIHQAQPQVEVIRGKLREFYELGGAHRELAGVLIADADHGDDPLDRFNNYRRAAELLLYHVGDAAAAQPAARKALELNPEDHAAMMMYVDVLMGIGELTEAGRVLEASIAAQKKRTPELAVLQQRMGRVAALQGDRENHLGWLKKAFEVDRKNAEIAAELAQLATEAGDYELALKPLRAISLMENPSPVTRPMALLWEAKIEHARGNRAKAELWAKKALREDPAFSEAQQFLDELGAH
jgi:tetratricopeptide (TPR) repeat protein